MPESSPLVLIIRLDGIGDALALTPLLAALHRQAIPADVVLRPSNAGIFAARAVRRVVEARFDLRSSTAANLAAIDDLGAALRREGYTHALVATEDPGGYRLARAAGARSRIGFFNGWGKPLKSLWTRRFLTQRIYRTAGLDPAAPHECQVLFRLGSALTSEREPTRDPARLRPLVLDQEPARDARVAIQLTDKWDRLGMKAGDVLELVRAIARVAPIRAIAARSEAPPALAYAHMAGIDVEFFDQLEPWKEAIGSARALVAPDSGAVHVAGMVATPVVAVFPPTGGLALQTARWSPWAAPHRIVSAGDAWPQRASEALAELLA